MKLTKAMKEQVIEGMVNERFQIRLNTLRQEEHVLAERVYNHLLGPHLSVVKTLPERYFEEKSSLDLTIPALDRNGQPTTKYVTLCLGQTFRSPSFLRWRYDITLPITHPLVVEIDDFCTREKALKNKKDVLRSALTDAINQTTTDVKLLELLPEAEPHVRALTIEDNTKALTVSFAKARQLLKEDK